MPRVFTTQSDEFTMIIARLESRAIAICLFLIVATAALYSPVRNYDFVRFDDPRYVSENPYIQEGVTLEMLRWSATSAYKSNWHPLTWISHAVDVDLFGIDPGPHHLVNVALHIFNVLLIFGLLRSMTGSVWRSGFVAGVFALHPLHLESVVWIAQRKDVLSTFFGLLSIGAYVHYTRTENDRFRNLSFWLLGIGLLAKSMLVTLPFLLLLLDYWPLRRMRWPFGPEPDSSKDQEFVPLRKLLREKVDFFFLIIPLGVITTMAQSSGGGLRGSDLVPLHLRVANAAVSYVVYIYKTLWPIDLAVHYPHPNMAIVGGAPLTATQIIGSMLFLGALTAIVIYQHQRRYLFVGWFWFVGLLVPTIGLVQVGTQSHADRYTYLSMVGITIALTWGAAELLRSVLKRPIIATTTLALGGAGVLLTLSLVSAEQLPTWRNSVTLFEQVLRVSPNDTVIMNNLGNELVARDRLDEGIAMYRRGLEIAPRYRKLNENLAKALTKKRQLE